MKEYKSVKKQSSMTHKRVHQQLTQGAKSKKETIHISYNKECREKDRNLKVMAAKEIKRSCTEM